MCNIYIQTTQFHRVCLCSFQAFSKRKLKWNLKQKPQDTLEGKPTVKARQILHILYLERLVMMTLNVLCVCIMILRNVSVRRWEQL